MIDLDRHAWPMQQVPEALAALARVAQLPTTNIEVPPPPRAILERNLDALNEWLELAASASSIEIESVSTTYGEVEPMLRRAGPALVVLSRPRPCVIAIAASARQRISIVSPDQLVHEIDLEQLRSLVCGPLETLVESFVTTVLDRTGVAESRRDRARRALLAQRLGNETIEGFFLLRPAPSGALFEHARRLGLPRRIVTIVAANTAQQILLMASFVALGRAALEGHFDTGWLIAWSLLLVSMLPLRLLSMMTAMLFSLDASALVKQRLLVGALALDSSDMRKMGAGRLLGQVFDAEAIEALMVGGGLSSLAAVVDLVLALATLMASGMGPIPVVVLIAWLFLAAWMLFRYWNHRRVWTETRLSMTYEVIDHLVGHRTRIVQEPADTFHEDEDRTLSRYAHQSRRLDDAEIAGTIFVRRGYFVVGVASLAPGVLSGASTTSMAIAVGAILLASRGLAAVVGGAIQIAGAAIAWKNISPLYRAAGRTEVPSQTLLSVLGDERRSGAIIDARHLSYRYPGRNKPVITDVNIRIADGDRVLLQGASGAGKSTLGSILAGLREPTDGLLMVRGLDRRTLGLSGIRRKIASAPQFQENHVITAPFAWNLLMGRAWPPRTDDLAEAEAVCHELGLGDLIQKMPAGMMQMVGETGWQLSHGEKSRLYIARALLQKADLIVLDESFAALDPETLESALQCVFSRANAVVVIAHP